MSDFGEAKNVIARKRHICIYCGGPIPKGEQHSQFKGKWDGEWQDWRMHAECPEQQFRDDPHGLEPIIVYGAEMPDRVRVICEAEKAEAGR